jgi:hypothetical protein
VLDVLLISHPELDVLASKSSDGVLVRPHVLLMRRDLPLGCSLLYARQQRNKPTEEDETNELKSDTVLYLVRAIYCTLLLLSELRQDCVLSSDGILLSKRRKVSIVGLRFLGIGYLVSSTLRDGGRGGRTSVLSRWTFSSRLTRLNTLELFCSSSVDQAAESRSISP